MIDILADWGYIGLFIGSFVAATVVPFSSDVLLVGILMAGGDPVMSLISATAGNWLGGLTSFAIGWAGRWEWIEKWFRVKRETLERQKSKVDRYGALLAFMTWLPFIGDIFAIAVGFYRLNPWKCSVYMLLGKASRFLIWTILFQYCGGSLPWLA